MFRGANLFWGATNEMGRKKFGVWPATGASPTPPPHKRKKADCVWEGKGGVIQDICASGEAK